jgi:DNA-directed RNA polymerase specialized sigma24 family protein
MPIRPLTHRGQDGQPYHRRPEVEAQIAATIDLPADELARRASIREARNPDFLRDETLVYHLRQSADARNKALLNQLWEPFGERLARYARGPLKSLPQLDADDAKAELSATLVEWVLSSDDRVDYCEVSFQQFVSRRATSLFNQKIKHNNRAARDLRLTDERDFDENGATSTGIVVAGGREDDAVGDAVVDNLTIRQVYRELEQFFAGDPRPYQAWRLRAHGLPVGPQGAPGTIAARFAVTDRTIRNWLAKVEAFLVEWRKRNPK